MVDLKLHGPIGLKLHGPVISKYFKIKVII